MKFNRFIVLGDSFSEGMSDEIVNGKYRGWADRTADVMAGEIEGFTYLNFAVRGKLIPQVMAEQLPAAIPFITGKDTLISFHAGANDVIRPTYKPEVTLPAYADALRKVAATGATVMCFTVLENTGNKGKGSVMWADRFKEFNANVRKVAADVGAIVLDANQEGYPSDARYLAFDRLHLNPIGHYVVSQAVCQRLGLPYDPEWNKPLPPAKKKPWIIESATTLVWFFTFALPWVWRRIRGVSSGDGLPPKYPTPTEWLPTK